AASQCWCSCADFDNKPDRPDPDWLSKASQVYYGLIELGLQPVFEISQSGQAAHVWIFFDEPTDAWIPRAFWKALAERLGTPIREVYPARIATSARGLATWSAT